MKAKWKKHVMNPSDRIDAHSQWNFFYSLLLVLGCILAYSNTMQAPFLLDDVWNITRNPCVRDFSFHNLFIGCPDTGVSGRPLVTLSFALNFMISGEHVWSYHLFNLMVHIFSTLSLFGICTATFLSPPLEKFFGRNALLMAFISAAIWSLHPFQTQSVTYLTQRLESMMGLFFLLAFYSAIRGWQSPKKRYWHALSVLCVLLGVGTKEVIVAAPLVIFVYDYLFVHHDIKTTLKQSRFLYAGMVVCWMILGLWVMTGRTSAKALGATNDFGPLQYFLTQPRAILHYLGNAFWPQSLSLDHGDRLFQSAAFQAGFNFAYILALVLSLTIVIATILLIVKKRYIGFALFWFLVILAPTSSILPLYCPIEDHRMYLPLAGIIVAVVSSALYFSRQFLHIRRSGGENNIRWLALGFFAIILALGAATRQRNQLFTSGLTIWQDTVDKSPQNPRAHTHLSLYLAENGKLEQAVRHASMALKIDPHDADAHINLAGAYRLLGRNEEAKAHLLQSIRLKDNNASAHYNLANIYDDQGLAEKALFQYRRALALDNLDPRIHTNYAHLLNRLGRTDLAIHHYQEAIRLSPDYYLAYNNLGLMMLKLKRLDKAMALFKQVLAIKADFAGGYFNMGYALYLNSRPDQAVAYLKKAVALKPDYADTYYLLTKCYLALKDKAAALSAFAEVRKRDPDMAWRLSQENSLLDLN